MTDSKQILVSTEAQAHALPTMHKMPWVQPELRKAGVGENTLLTGPQCSDGLGVGGILSVQLGLSVCV